MDLGESRGTGCRGADSRNERSEEMHTIEALEMEGDWLFEIVFAHLEGNEGR